VRVVTASMQRLFAPSIPRMGSEFQPSQSTIYPLSALLLEVRLSTNQKQIRE
jgi:hypothetical protein